MRLDAEFVQRVRDYSELHNEPLSVTVATALAAYLQKAMDRNPKQQRAELAGRPEPARLRTFAQINVRLDAEFVQRVRDYSELHNEPLSVTVAAALAAYLQKTMDRNPEQQRVELARAEAELAAQLDRYVGKLKRRRFFEGKWQHLLVPMRRAGDTLRAGAGNPIATARAVLDDAAFVDLARSLPEWLGNAQAGLAIDRVLDRLKLIVALQRRVILYSTPT